MSYRTLCGCILLVSGVLMFVYSAIYTSQLTIPQYEEQIKSIEDVAANPEIKVYTTRGSTLTNYLLVSKDRI